MRTLFAILAFSVGLSAAEPIAGKWHLDAQEVNGKPTKSEPMVLQVTPQADKLEFRFSLPVNNIYFVSMEYTVKLDGTEADVKNSQDQKIGTIKMTRGAASQYKLTIRGPGRPESNGTLTVSADDKTLLSESDSADPSRPAHVKQTFSRY